jgi:hypothetical protein
LNLDWLKQGVLLLQYSILQLPAKSLKVTHLSYILFRRGDKVSIPSRFACTGAKDQTGILQLAIQTTGKAILTIPGKFTYAELAVSGKNVDLSVTGANNGGSAIEINPAVLSKGRGEILLKP